MQRAPRIDLLLLLLRFCNDRDLSSFLPPLSLLLPPLLLLPPSSSFFFFFRGCSSTRCSETRRSKEEKRGGGGVEKRRRRRSARCGLHRAHVPRVHNAPNRSPGIVIQIVAYSTTIPEGGGEGEEGTRIVPLYGYHHSNSLSLSLPLLRVQVSKRDFARKLRGGCSPVSREAGGV